MDKKFISHNRMLMVYGLIGTLLYSIICTVTTCAECKFIDNNNTSELSDYICKVNNTDNISLHLENFNTFFNNFNKLNKPGEIILEIFVIILGILSFFINKYFTILIIKYLSPIHVIFSIPIIFILEKIVLIIYTIIILIIKEEKLEKEIIFKTDNE